MSPLKQRRRAPRAKLQASCRTTINETQRVRCIVKFNKVASESEIDHRKHTSQHAFTIEEIR